MKFLKHCCLCKVLKRRRGGALRIVEIGGKWAMEVRPDVAEHLPKDTKTEMPKKLLKAAALIAYHQPMPQSRLVEFLDKKPMITSVNFHNMA